MQQPPGRFGRQWWHAVVVIVRVVSLCYVGSPQVMSVQPPDLTSSHTNVTPQSDNRSSRVYQQSHAQSVRLATDTGNISPVRLATDTGNISP